MFRQTPNDKIKAYKEVIRANFSLIADFYYHDFHNFENVQNSEKSRVESFLTFSLNFLCLYFALSGLHHIR